MRWKINGRHYDFLLVEEPEDGRREVQGPSLKRSAPRVLLRAVTAIDQRELASPRDIPVTIRGKSWPHPRPLRSEAGATPTN